MPERKTGRPRRPAARLLAGAVGIAAALYGAGVWFESFAAPAGCCGLIPANPLQAARLLAEADPQGRRPDAQLQAAAALVASRPVDPEGWLRIAYADYLADGRLGPSGAEALDNSYALAPYAGSNAPWRIAFVLQNWDDVAPRTRRDVASEMRGLLKDDLRRARGQQTAGLVTHPAGRAAAVEAGVLRPDAPGGAQGAAP